MSQVIIALSNQTGQPVISERKSAAGSAIKAGYLLQQNAANEVLEHAVAGGSGQKLFALPNLPVGGTTSDTYAVGDSVRLGAFHSGQEVFVKLAPSAAAIVIGDEIESAGNGTMRVQAAGEVLAYAVESVDNSGDAVNEAFIKVRIA